MSRFSWRKGRRIARAVAQTVVVVITATLLWGARPAQALPFDAERGRLAVLDYDFPGAHAILDGGEAPDVVVERARLALYEGACDEAQRLLERPDLEDDDTFGMLYAIAKGCARATAGTFVVHDEAAGVWVRFQDDEDRALLPLLVQVTTEARRALARDLGADLPNPIRIDMVRDQFALAAHTGLPEEAAQTTGTVAVAKWGRVIMLSPRATEDGYPWADTLAHELSHLVVSMITRDRAPLWLQEGVAKRQEVRWRPLTRFDDVPSPDAVAWEGIEAGIALPLTGLGPSIAMLPSPEQAMVAFAEVASFVRFWVDENGTESLPKLLIALKELPPDEGAAEAIAAVSGGVSFETWEQRWRARLAATTPTAPAELSPARALPVKGVEAARHRRLAQLLQHRGHHEPAVTQVQRAREIFPRDASLRCLHAVSLRSTGRETDAAAALGTQDDILRPSGRWWSLHDFFELGRGEPQARRLAVGREPYNPPVACLELEAGELPDEPVMRILCEAARRLPPRE
ncbi:MAG: hypothetical protein AAF928_11785 [Myxococcota bacterium]